MAPERTSAETRRRNRKENVSSMRRKKELARNSNLTPWSIEWQGAPSVPQGEQANAAFRRTSYRFSRITFPLCRDARLHASGWQAFRHRGNRQRLRKVRRSFRVHAVEELSKVFSKPQMRSAQEPPTQSEKSLAHVGLIQARFFGTAQKISQTDPDFLEPAKKIFGSVA